MQKRRKVRVALPHQQRASEAVLRQKRLNPGRARRARTAEGQWLLQKKGRPTSYYEAKSLVARRCASKKDDQSLNTKQRASQQDDGRGSRRGQACKTHETQDHKERVGVARLARKNVLPLVTSTTRSCQSISTIWPRGRSSRCISRRLALEVPAPWPDGHTMGQRNSSCCRQAWGQSKPLTRVVSSRF